MDIPRHRWVPDRTPSQAPAVLGSLFFTGAIWATVASTVNGGWPDVRNTTALVAAIAGAYVVGSGLMAWGVAGRRLPVAVAHVILAAGTVAATTVAWAGGPVAAGPFGGYYSYVAAYGFLFLGVRAGVAHLLFASGLYAAALLGAGAPAPFSMWITNIGIAVGGAGLVGALGSRLAAAYRAEAEAAAQARKLDAMKSTFLQAVSHELRTPLTVVTGYAETLRARRGELPDAVEKRILDGLVRAAGRLDVLVADLLDLDRLRSSPRVADRGPTHLPSLVRDAVDQVETRDITVHRLVEDVTVSVEHERIERIVVNLVANAVRHAEAHVEIHAVLHDGCCRIDVFDDGRGVPAEIRDEIFRPFVQGPDAAGRARPGTGIGLSIVREFVALHGGRVWVDESPSGGAAFHVELPDAQVAPLTSIRTA